MKPRVGSLTIAAYLLLAAFAGVDLAAHLTKYEHGETVSASIWQGEKLIPPLRLLIGAGLAVLFTHLEFQTP